MKNWTSVFVLALFGVAIVGCGKDDPKPVMRFSQNISTEGRFTSEYCFLNKLASQGFGSNIYSRALLQFNPDGTGKNEFRLYTDDLCENEALRGENQFTYHTSRVFGSVSVISISQENDPSDPSNRIDYWLPISFFEGGAIIDIDYRDGDSAPYLTEPTESEIADFIANPSVNGVLFERE